MLLTALDFPFCFAAVRYLGADRIGHYEHVLVESVKSAIPEQVKQKWRELIHGSGDQVVVVPAGGGTTNVDRDTNVDQIAVPAGFDHGVRDAEERSTKENASKYIEDQCDCDFPYGIIDEITRYLDTASAGICHTQEFHLHQSTGYCCYHTQGCQDTQGLGLGHWEKETKAMKYQRDVGTLYIGEIIVG